MDTTNSFNNITPKQLSQYNDCTFPSKGTSAGDNKLHPVWTYLYYMKAYACLKLTAQAELSSSRHACRSKCWYTMIKRLQKKAPVRTVHHHQL
jgi:hypothetical protein